MKIKKFSFVGVLEEIKKLNTIGDGFDLAMNAKDDEEDSAMWVRIELVEFFNSKVLLIGGYGYDVRVLCNLWDNNKLDDEMLSEDVLGALNSYLEDEGCYSCMGDEVYAIDFNEKK